MLKILLQSTKCNTNELSLGAEALALVSVYLSFIHLCYYVI